MSERMRSTTLNMTSPNALAIRTILPLLSSRAGGGCSGQQDAPRRARASDANTPRTPDRFQRSSAEVEDLGLRDGERQTEESDRGREDDGGRDLWLRAQK